MDDVGALVADLEAALGPGQARAEPLELALYQRDAGVDRGAAAAVCFPTRGADVAAAVRVAARHGRSFVARGSGTGLAGGATPVGDPLVIVTTHLTRILEVNAEDQYAWVEPGVLNLDLSRAAHRRPPPARPPRSPDAAPRLHVDGGGRPPRERHHRRGHRARRARDDGRRDHPSRRGLRRRGIPA